MPLSPSDHARVAARGRWSDMPAEQRRAATKPARTAQAVKTLVENWPELRPDQIARLRALLQPVGGDRS